jgi:hypothetical protein
MRFVVDLPANQLGRMPQETGGGRMKRQVPARGDFDLQLPLIIGILGAALGLALEPDLRPPFR